MKIHITLLLLFINTILLGQAFEISGTIQSNSNQPISSVNVYISGSSIGTSTNNVGRFTLKNIKPGHYDLIVSHINYEMVYRQVKISNQSVDLGIIRTKELSIDLATVVVNQKQDKKWNKHFKTFKTFLLGEHYKNKNIAIPDSYNADFNIENRMISASYPFQLNIINTYTGFEIFYAVEAFQIGKKGPQYILGYPRFTELQPNNDQQKNEWQQNRFDAYRGSVRHFFYALLNDALENNGFKAQLTNTIIADKDQAVSETNRYTVMDRHSKFKELLTIHETENPAILRIKFKDYLRIQYLNEMGKDRLGQFSMLQSPEGYIDVYKNGIPVNPTSFYIYGHLASEGIYESLPTDYSFNDAKQSGLSETSPLTETANKLLKHVTEYPVEKVYLHLAKPYLAYNEVMWFQAYVVAGPEHIPTPLSQNLTVELLDENLEKIDQQELFVENGMAIGDFLIADSLESETFYLRAYTDWMLNFDEDFIELRKFEIVDKTEASPKPKPTPLLRFFAEGGNLVQGLNAQLAFEYNLGEDAFEGEIRDQDNHLIKTFSGRDYRGKINFKPEKGKSYYATIKGQDQKFELPLIKASGIVLSVKNDNQYGQIYMALSTNESIENKTGHLIIHTRGLIQYYEKIEWNDQAMSLNVPTNIIADGLSHITYFDENMRPHAERLFFKKEQEKLKIDLNLSDQAYTLRERTDVFLNISNIDGIGQLASASISVVDYNQIDPAQLEQNITSNLLLSSDIEKGLQNSLQYLENNTETHEKLDLLLLTKGWRRFNWDDLSNKEFEVKYAPKVGFSVSGQVFAKKGKKPVKETSILHLSQFNGNSSFQESVTSALGEFSFAELQYFQGNSYLQMNNIKSGTRLKFAAIERLSASKAFLNAQYTSPKVVFEEKQQRLFDVAEMQAILDSTYYRDLGTFVVEASKYQELQAKQERGFLYMQGNYSYSVTDLMKRGSAFRTPLHVLLGRLPGFEMVMNITDPLNPKVRMNRRDEGITANTNPGILYLVDDGRVTLQDIMQLNPVIIDRIEVQKASQAFHTFGTAAGGGVIAIYTKTPEELEEYNRYMVKKASSNKDFDQFILPGGYYAAREFYAPDYSTPQPEHSRADYRNVIHWETKIRTDENGNYSFSFYNADIPTEAMITLEGITDKGEAFTKTITYEITNRIK